MDENLERLFQESESDWAEIQRLTDERAKKDKKIISIYCAKNKRADIIRILELLEKYNGLEQFNGLPKHDKDIVDEFKTNFPDSLTVKMIHNFEDTRDIYREYLEYGEENP